MSSAVATTTRRPAPVEIQESLRLAAIDVGSNSIHMIVAQADADGAVTTLWRMKEPVGLGRISFPSRRLSREAMDRAVATLDRFQRAAKLRQAEKIIAVATSAVREAINGGDLIERVKRELGLYLRVVSARDEARLIYLGVRHAVQLHDKPHLIMDIGGGSVEFIVGDEKRASLLESRKLGAARMTARFVSSDPISDEDRKAMLKHYDHELAPLCEAIERLHPVRAIGTSGTLENLAAMCAGDNGNGSAEAAIERDRLDALIEKLVHSTSEQRATIRGLDDQRKDQVLAGALLVGEVMKRLHLKRVTLCGSALREGILLDYLSRHIPDLQIRRQVPDPRRRSVLDLARRCDWHETHSRQVANLTLELFDALRPIHHLGAEERELLEYAALLHDIGWHIGRSKHHKHSMYLIMHGDLRGFDPEEVQIIANVARYHRGGRPKEKHAAYTALSARARRIVDVGAALLRLADGLDRSHASVVQSVRTRLDRKRVKLQISARSDAELEIWGARRKLKLFERVFDRDAVVELDSSARAR